MMYIVFADKKKQVVIGTVSQAARNLWIWRFGSGFDERRAILRYIHANGRVRTVDMAVDAVHMAYNKRRL